MVQDSWAIGYWLLVDNLICLLLEDFYYLRGDLVFGGGSSVVCMYVCMYARGGWIC